MSSHLGSWEVARELNSDLAGHIVLAGDVPGDRHLR